MSHQYQRPHGTGLRLHLNENTAGCSPKVLAALRALTREQAAFYPDYDRAIDACAARFGIAAGNLLLTNGLDEGLLLAAIVSLRGAPADDPYEAIIVQPAFDMYAAVVDALGGRLVQVAPEPDFAFPLQRLTRAVTARTRVIYLTSPNNPTGISIPRDIVAAVAKAAPQALVLLDEAYADFCDQTMIEDAVSGRVPNLVVGRTFAKAYGLAGLRIGAVMGSAERLAPFRAAILPYPLNSFATAALPAAFADVDYYEWYLAEVRESKRMLYDVLRRLGVRYWESDGNFVLARFDSDLDRVVAGLAERGIAIRDRSRDPGCAGCARITTGVTDHTRHMVAALEEVLCAAG